MQNKNIKLAIVLVTSLFFLWGLSYGLVDVMNKNFQTHLNVTKAESGFIQAAYFGAYFVFALPAGMIAKRYSYKVGIIVGLFLYALGALLIVPAASMQNFSFFLFAFFVLACGLSALETNANPYITTLGDEKNSSFRINVAQSFNGVGQFLGPIIAGQLLLSFAASNDIAHNMSNISKIYVSIAIIVLVIMVIFVVVKMPDSVKTQEQIQAASVDDKKLFEHKNFTLGVVAQFLYIAAQVSAGAFFINYALDHWSGLTAEHAAYFFSIALIAFMLGRIGTTPLMKIFKGHTILGVYSLINTVLIFLVFAGIEKVSVIVLIAVFFFMSISFPTIFALALRGMSDNHVKTASSVLVMSIVGGAIMPYIMGKVADISNIQTAYLLLAPCFLFVAWYAFTTEKRA
ncbi:L-fucose:H+ symporter permease [Campylobacter geochelonis]|uniref:L-fucose:H+ symporter permease n=1 Tax=Campylobacter geochelonis TaxID=1780362 RepID=A0A128EHJ0_9BACT|nr:L-fucose:H+ symporter permease [Campylobacter geochelonis]QKF71095.1 L-fucose permease [Campylobacter geochelonis]CZE48345.1 L-fucose:H+ symporter permease [Campylobacter geochelonis]CZE48883.1 L-fucose:H+ symporter permease [Campylobacter geochelonis]CZE50089.1 L-fucose:H+ symporter permease [Campylobacter geochelonis]